MEDVSVFAGNAKDTEKEPDELKPKAFVNS